MLQHPTLDQLRHLKLHGMARAFAELNDCLTSAPMGPNSVI